MGSDVAHGSEGKGPKDFLSTHCLICDAVLSNTSGASYNIFGQLRQGGDSCARGSVFEKVSQVLNRSLHSIRMHSEVVCNKCFNLLIEHEEIKYRLQELESRIEAKYNATAENHGEEKRGKVILQHHQNKNWTSESGNKSSEHVSTRECTEDKTNEINQVALLMREQGAKNITKKVKFGRLTKSYICSVCGKTFRAFSHRVEHMLIHLNEKPWSCKECLKTFRTKSALRVHEAKHSGIRPHTCQHCNKSFLDRHYFEEHQRVHSGERPFACSFCSRLFARKKDLSVHTKSHTGDKPYKCSSCTKTFAVKSRLNRHLKIHSGERPYSCEHCSKSFARRDDYQVHMRTHTGERPFRCGVCDKTFTNKSNCLVHVRLHQSVKYRHQCPACGKGFKQKTKMQEHLKTHQHAKSESTETHLASEDNVMSSEGHTVYLQSLDHVENEPPQAAIEEGLVDHAPFTQPVLQLDTVQNVTVTHIPSLPVTQVAQLDWGKITTGATTTFVNITPGTYVSII